MPIQTGQVPCNMSVSLCVCLDRLSMTGQGGKSRTVPGTPCCLIQHSLGLTLPVCLPCPLMVPRWLPKYSPQGPLSFHNVILCIHFIAAMITQQGVQEKTHACCHYHCSENEIMELKIKNIWPGIGYEKKGQCGQVVLMSAVIIYTRKETVLSNYGSKI